MVNSLLAQLLTQCKNADVSRAARLGDLDCDDVEETMTRFEKVLGRLGGASVVFCVIDGISFYVDDDHTEQDATYVIERLVRLTVKASKGRPVFKLLLTAPVRLRVGEEILGESTILSVPTTPPKTGGFTAERWEVGVGKYLDALSE